MQKSEPRIEPLERRWLCSAATVSLSLINADTNQPITGYSPIASGATLDLAQLPTRHLNIKATPSSSVGSVLFGYDGNATYHNENVSPYEIAGDTNGKANAWTPSVGSHTLVVTPFSGANDSGAAGTPTTISFTITDSSASSSYIVPSPVAGGVVRHVNPSGTNRASKTIAAALALAKAGDVVLIDPGTYHESIKLAKGGNAGAPITIAAATLGGTIIDGSGFSYIFDGTYVSYINLQGVTFNNCNNPLETSAVRIGSHFNVSDVTVQNTNAQGMIVYGSNTTLLRVTAQYNGQEGLGGVNCSNITVKNCITRFNNPGLTNPSWAGSSFASQVNGLWYVNADYEAGAGKWSSTSNVTLDGVNSYSNHGTGIWFDGPNTNVVIQNCTVHDAIPIKAFYEGVGISIEMNNTGPVTVQNNNCYNDPGGVIVVASSRHVHVKNNTFGGSYIALNDWPRGADYTMQDVSFTNNTMNNTFIWTGGDNWVPSSGADKNVVFDYDTYKGMTGPLFRWGKGVYQLIADVRSGLNLEAHGSQSA